MVPRDGGIAFHVTGTDYYEPVEAPSFATTAAYWEQELVSETAEVYRGEYLAASILFDAEEGKGGLDLERLHKEVSAGKLEETVRAHAQERFDEGYERGIHDSDAARILSKLLQLHKTAGLLRFGPTPRGLAALFWARAAGADQKRLWQRTAQSLGRLVSSFHHSPAIKRFGGQLAVSIGAFLDQAAIGCSPTERELAGRYLAEELRADRPRFTASAEAVELRDAFYGHLAIDNARAAFEEDLRALQDDLRAAFALVRAWIEAFLDSDRGPALRQVKHAVVETAALILTERQLERDVSSAATQGDVSGLLGQHPRIQSKTLALRLDEFL
jgi:hypothetical protein